MAALLASELEIDFLGRIGGGFDSCDTDVFLLLEPGRRVEGDV
jgi:hypothetical protein